MEKGRQEAMVERFWEDVRAKRGGEASARSFGRYIGTSGSGELSERTGLVYLAAGSLWFEAVKSPKKIMGFILGAGNDAVDDDPFELGVSLGDIADSGCVSLRDACACVRGAFGPERLKPFGFLDGVFGQPAVQVKLRDGGSVFFEVFGHKDLLAALRGAGIPAAGRA